MFNAVSPVHVFNPNPFIAAIHNPSPNNASPETAAPAAQPNTHEPTATSTEIQLSLPVDDLMAAESLSQTTLELAARDVRMVLQEQSQQSQVLTTKLNILFVANGALLTSLSISRLMVSGSLFSLAEALGFLVSFSLLIGAFLPRQVAVTPNLEDRKFLETYLALSPRDYQLQMVVNLAETYNANKQRLEDISQSLQYAGYTIWATATIMLVHILVVYMAIGL
jgi:hypothetical protein